MHKFVIIVISLFITVNPDSYTFEGDMPYINNVVYPELLI